MLSRNHAAFLTGFLALFGAANAQPLPEDAPFASEIYSFLVEDELIPPAHCKSLFVGSSSIRFWFTIENDLPDLDIVRRGFGGSQMEHVNLYFDMLVARHRPARIFLYEGENDINAGDTPETVLSDLEVFLDKKTEHLGDAPVYFISIKPSPVRAQEFDRQKAANTLVQNLARTRKDLIYIDIVEAMTENGAPKDIFIFDDLHMNRDGYKLWAAEIKKALEAETAPAASACQ